MPPDIDFQSPTWLSLKAWVEKKLADCRKRNDMPLPENETNFLRGQITILKTLLMLEDAPQSSQDIPHWRKTPHTNDN